jgi:hypothetical protein
MMNTKLTTKWQTICTVGFSGSVSRDENPAAHGGVKLCQARRHGDKIIARFVNTNGRHQEVGDKFEIDEDRIADWESIEKSSR